MAESSSTHEIPVTGSSGAYVHDEMCHSVIEGGECSCYVHALEEKDSRIEKLVAFARLQKEQIEELVEQRDRYREMYSKLAGKEGAA